MSDTALRICSRLARESGRINAFAVNGASLDAAALDQCNARAKPAAAADVARR